MDCSLNSPGRCLKIIDTLRVSARREKDGEKFWGDYEWLYNESLKYS